MMAVTVADVWEGVKRVLGSSRDDLAYDRLTEAVEILANKGDFDPLTGYLDVVVTDGRYVTLPAEVETVQALNMIGRPAVPRDVLFMFHLNGPGETGPELEWQWTDFGQQWSTFREPVNPTRLLALCANPDDEDCELVVYGYDELGNEIRSLQDDGTWASGWSVPVGTALPALPEDAPVFARITRVRKARTTGPVQLVESSATGEQGETLAVYQWNETEPRYRRIKLSQAVKWVRVTFRRRRFKLSSQTDLLPIAHKPAILLMVKSLKLYYEDKYSEAEAAEATASRWLQEAQKTDNVAAVHPITVWDHNQLVEQTDYVD